jgi:hypothetical protein
VVDGMTKQQLENLIDDFGAVEVILKSNIIKRVDGKTFKKMNFKKIKSFRFLKKEEL